MIPADEPSRSQPLPPMASLGGIHISLGTRPDRSPRPLLVAIAITILVVSGISGLIYLQLWNKAGQDLTRLLGDDVSLYAATEAPWETVQHTVRLPRWRAPDALQTAVARTGVLASGTVDTVAGVPMSLLREAQLLQATTRLEVAWVPTDAGQALLLFVEIPDLIQRKRLISRLQDRLETVDRHAGFRIEAVWQSPWTQLVEQDIDAPRVIVMEPYIVFAWGADAGLEELVEARVGGRTDNLRAASVRTLDGVPPRHTDAQLHGTVSAQALWEALRPAGARGRAALADAVDGVRVAAAIRGDTEVVSVDVRARRPAVVNQLQRALAPAPLGLVDRVPDDAKWVVAGSVRDPLTVALSMRQLLASLASDLYPDVGATTPTAEPPQAPEALQKVMEGLSGVSILASEVASSLAGEFVWSELAGPGPSDWVLMARFERPALAEQTLEQLLPTLLDDDLAYGRIREGGGTLHIVRPATATGAPEEPGEVLAWRIRAGLVEIAPRVEVLDALAKRQAEGRTLGATGRARSAIGGLTATPAIVAMADPAHLAAWDVPVLREAATLLRPDFMVGATLHLETGWVRLETNLGPWTLASVVAAADAKTVDRWVLAGLSAPCRVAYQALCARYPQSVVCHPLALGRRDRLEAACAALQTR